MAGALSAGPVSRFDGLAADAPPRAIRPRPRVWSNPFLRLVTFGVVLVVVGGSIALTGRLVAGLQPGPLSPVVVVVGIVSLAVAYAVLVRLVEGRREPAEVSARRLPLGLVVGLGLGAGLFVVCFLAIWALGGFRVLGVRTPDWGPWWMSMLVVGASAGITEEIAFRGVGYRILEELAGTWAAVVVSGVLFGAAHLGNPDATVAGAVGIAVAGFVFALLYVTTRNLWLMMGFHAAWNVVQGPVLGVIVSGTGAPNGFLHVEPVGSDLVSGGVFGAEGSLVTVAVMVLATAWLGVRVVRQRQVVAPMWTRRARQRRALAAGRTPDAASLDAKQRRALAASVPVGALEAVGEQDAALDGQGHPGDPGRLVGGEEQQRVRDV